MFDTTGPSPHVTVADTGYLETQIPDYALPESRPVLILRMHENFHFRDSVMSDYLSNHLDEHSCADVSLLLFPHCLL